LTQTLRDFELVIVDDASTDGTRELLATCRDPRLRIVETPYDMGPVGARNIGFANCRGLYVALSDDDDLSRPNRLALQAAFLDAHPEVVLVGSRFDLLQDDRLRPGHLPRGVTPTLLEWMLHVGNPIAYSSVMLRSRAVRQIGGFMRPERPFACDFDLHHRMLRIGKLALLDDPLLIYRRHARVLSICFHDRMAQDAAGVLAGAYGKWLGTEAQQTARVVVRHLGGRRLSGAGPNSIG
jgi:glycosyltransferase involved in cell wall biosynthesis